MDHGWRKSSLPSLARVLLFLVRVGEGGIAYADKKDEARKIFFSKRPKICGKGYKRPPLSRLRERNIDQNM